MDLRNVGILPQHYTVSQLTRPRLERKSLLWKSKFHCHMSKSPTVAPILRKC